MSSPAPVHLPKKFYESVGVRERAGGYAIELDARSVRTPKRQALLVPTAQLAQQIANEWRAQGENIDPATMPLTKIANTAIDGVCGREGVIHDDIVRFIANDLVCYRADHPESLAARQAQAWDPVLHWVQDAYGARFRTVTGVMPVTQSVVDVAKAASALSNASAFALAPLHLMTTLTGSALLVIALHQQYLNVHEAWRAAHIDEDWQIEQWGVDSEAVARRDLRWGEMVSAAQFLTLAKT